MNTRIWLSTIGMCALSACTPRATVPNGTAVLDEDVALERQAGKPLDTAIRELPVEDGAILVAFVDENLTDVKLTLTTLGGEPATKPVEVENHMTGTGVEIAALEVPEGASVRVTLTSAQDAAAPGKVHLRVRQYTTDAARDPNFAAQLGAFRAWTAATDAASRASAIKKTGLAEMQRAIDGLEGAHGDAALAAQARLIKSRMLSSFAIDFLEARAEAERAATAFTRLPKPDALNAARARYLEAVAQSGMSQNHGFDNPTAAEAMKRARETLEQLSMPTSVFGPVERARAIGDLGTLDVTETLIDDANKHFEQARAMFAAAGYVAGEREMRFQLAIVFLEQARFADAARALDPLLPEIDRITNTELRVTAYLGAAHAQTFSGRMDEAADLLLKALPLAREYELPQMETMAVKGLGVVYQARGDMLQASSFFDEAVKIARGQQDVSELVFALIAAGHVAGMNGDLERAFALHEEAARLAPNPIARVRTRINLATDNYRNENYPAAIALLREALAVDLHDPRHHAYTDGKIGLAVSLVDYDQSTPKDLAEAARLLTEAMDTSIRVKDQYRVIYATRVRAQLDARLGKSAVARAGFERMFALAQEHRRRSASTEARSGMSYDEQVGFRGYLDIVFADVPKRGGVFQPATPAQLAGMQRLETARHENFGALRVGTLDAKTAAHVDDLLAQMAQKSLRIAALIGPGAAQTAELRALQIDMARLHAELDHVRTSAAASAPVGTRAWRALAPGTTQLSYALGTRRVYALVRGESGAMVTALAPSRQELEQQLIELAKLDARTSSQKMDAALEGISSALLPPGLLPAKSTAVEIVAEGRIASVSFPALRSPTDPRRRLVETHDIAMLTSLVDADAAPRPTIERPFRFVALASGNGTYRSAPADPAPRLQAATKEIRVAADLFAAHDRGARIKLLLGAEGSAAALRDIWASGADVVHFATHALADLRQPIASLLVLPATDSVGNPTYLTAGQVQGWRGDVELVFLSACDSAVGPPQYAAGTPGLQRAFLRAGARGVIATLAPIEDVLAQEFAADFYARYTTGLPAARALSATQRGWLKPRPGASEQERLRRRITALAHAYFEG